MQQLPLKRSQSRKCIFSISFYYSFKYRGEVLPLGAKQTLQNTLRKRYIFSVFLQGEELV